jgi:hypothetical protein
MSDIRTRLTRLAAEHATALAVGHADASHWGTFDGECARCVALCADAGFDLTQHGRTSVTGGPAYL